MKKGKVHLILTGLAALFSAPLWVATALMGMLKLLNITFAGTPPSATGLLFAPVFFIAILLSDMTRLAGIGLAALLLTVVALGWLVVRERDRVWSRGRFYLLTAILVVVLIFPLVMRYRPAVQAAPGVEMHLVEQPGLLEGTVRRCQAIAEVRGCQYEPLGWVDADTLVYRTWCGGRFTARGWQPGSPGAPMAYDVNTGDVGASLIDREPVRQRCDPETCVSPNLTDKQLFPWGYLPGEYPDPIISPDGRWVAFTAEHPYGPEDLLVISRE